MKFTTAEDHTMHAHDRTLVSQILVDPDRKDRRHDLACQYLARPEVAQKILEAIFGDLSKAGTRKKMFSLDACVFSCGVRKAQTVERMIQSSGVFFGSFGFEVHLTKGEGKYATTIGFVDLLIRGFWQEDLSWVEEVDFPECRESTDGSFRISLFVAVPAHTEMKPRTLTNAGSVRVIVEVKVTPVPVSDIIRQLKLYAAHGSSLPGSGAAGALALVTCYALTPAERAMLSHEEIESFELGKDFETWVQNESARVPEGMPEPTIL
jgi:hypothetical protein